MYYHGVGVEQNDAMALEYFQLAIRAPLAYQPHSLRLTSSYLAESYNNLGIIYQDGLGTKRDTKKAIAMYRKAAKFGSGNARVNLRTVYSRGSSSKRIDLLKPDYK
jgi:TPR repeat protein